MNECEFGSPGKKVKCETGYYKDYSEKCVACDPNCAPDACVDYKGCAECNAGNFLSLPIEEDEAATCVRCAFAIPGCARCVSAVTEGNEECEECDYGFTLLAGVCVDSEILYSALGSVGAEDSEEGIMTEIELEFESEYEEGTGTAYNRKFRNFG